MEDNGLTRGQGVSIYQFAFPIADIDLQEGDSVQFRIRHDMKREILPGIADIGIKISRE
jgi:gliding motility-associated lipoprotein GldH